MKAIVLIKISSLEMEEAYRVLKRVRSAMELHMLYGRFDAVATIQANTLQEIRRIILSEIQPIPGVIETMPCLIVEDDNPTTNRQIWEMQR